ncbi:hypothetical protein HDV03_003876 [Kappamyces sp. JEL0829]|nr:hypothetical protein HDV03_003876 [Kappamyces sp. JEL0829]
MSLFLFGCWVKRQKYLMDAVNLKTNEPLQTIRTRLVVGSFNWADWTAEERTGFTMTRFWPNSLETGTIGRRLTSR